jgi:hypothetical protein
VISPVASVLVGVGRLAFCRQSLIAASWSPTEEAADDAPEASEDADAPTSGDEVAVVGDVADVGVPVPPGVVLPASLQPVRASAATAADTARRAGRRVMGVLQGWALSKRHYPPSLAFMSASP